MSYKTGDTVWYLDITLDIPRIKKDVVVDCTKYVSLKRLQTHTDMIHVNNLYPTKEALLAAIDPPLHNFVVGQTVWYIEEADDPDTLRVEKACVISTTNETIEISISHPCVPNFTIEDLEIIFASPKEAVQKALELKQW